MTKFHYAGRYNGDPDSLITHEHEPGYVPFREADNMNKLALILNIASILIAIVMLGIYFIYSRQPVSIIGAVLSAAAIIPHEYLHGLCFEGDVYMYENMKKGMFFVVGPGTFSKACFIFMCMLPNIVFGFIPFFIFLMDPAQSWLGTLGALSISAGVGDYYNVFNALVQMPRGSRTYMHGMHSFWYMPEN